MSSQKPVTWHITTDAFDAQDVLEFDTAAEAQTAWGRLKADVDAGKLFSIGWKAYSEDGEVLHFQSYGG